MFFDANKKGILTPPQIHIGQTQIIPAQETKYLGFIIDKQLSYKAHINALTRKLSQLTGVFRKVSGSLTIQSMFLLYNSMIQSHLSYCVEVYGSAGSSLLNKVQRAQNKAIKALFHLPKIISSSSMYSKLEIQRIKHLYKSRSSIMIHKLLKEQKIGTTLNIHKNLFTQNPLLSHKYRTRGKNSFKLHYHRPSHTRGIIFNLMLIWNSLPPNIKEKANIKTHVANHFKNK
jgi:hypothetical protein